MRTPGHGYLGPVGSMSPVLLTVAEDEKRDARHGTRTSVSGVVYAQRRPQRSRRTWSVSADQVAARDHAYISQLADAQSGPRTVVWYSASAVVGNVLTPAVAAMGADQLVGSRMAGGSVVVRGMVHAPAPQWDGRVLDTITQTSTGIMSFGGDVPVPDETDVTASVHVTAQAGLRPQLVVREYDPQGVMVKEHRAQGALDAALERVSVSIVTDPRTVVLRMGTIGALRTAAPAVTLTDTLTPWTEGMGCLTAIVDEVSWSPAHGLYAGNAGDRIGTRSFTITEVG